MQSEKTIIVKELLDRVNSSPFVLIADYTGMKVLQFAELRKRLREAGSRLHVSKNTYVKRVIKEVGLPEGLTASLTGQTAVITGEQDVCAAAKILKTFAKETTRPKVRMGALDGKLLTGSDVERLADLPTKDQLYAQLLGLLNAPATNLLRLVNEPGARTARVVKAWADKGN